MYVCYNCTTSQLKAKNPTASLEFAVFSPHFIGIKTSAAEEEEEERCCCPPPPPAPAAMFIMLSSAMVSRVLGLGEHLSTVIIWGGAVSKASPMAATFSRIVSRVLCFGEHLSTVIIWGGAISNHELMPIDLFPIPPGCLFQLPHVVRTPIVCAHRAFSAHTHTQSHALLLLFTSLANNELTKKNSKMTPLFFWTQSCSEFNGNKKKLDAPRHTILQTMQKKLQDRSKNYWNPIPSRLGSSPGRGEGWWKVRNKICIKLQP